MPESAAVWGDPEAPVKVMLRVADAAPAVVGVKMTSMVQVEEAASVAAQVVPDVCAKSEALVPVKVIAIPVSNDLVLLFSVNVWGELGELRLTVPKSLLEGFTKTPAAAAGENLAMKASSGALKAAWKTPGFGNVGKLSDEVRPAI